jgi:hypothetical protein
MDQGRIKRRRGPHPARGPAVAHMWSKQSGIVNISKSYRSPRPVTGIAFFLFTLTSQRAQCGKAHDDDDDDDDDDDYYYYYY